MMFSMRILYAPILLVQLSMSLQNTGRVNRDGGHSPSYYSNFNPHYNRPIQYYHPILPETASSPLPHLEDVNVETTTVPARTTEEPAFDITPTLSQFQGNVNIWKDGFKRKVEQMIANINKMLTEKHKALENSLVDSAQRHINNRMAQKPPNLCSNSVEAIGILLLKLQGEIASINTTATTFPPLATDDNIYSQFPQSSTNNRLPLLQKLSFRLNTLGEEIATEKLSNCTQPLIQKYEEMTKELQVLEKQEKTQFRQAVIANSVEGIIQGQLSRVYEELEEITQFGGTELEQEMALSEIINKTISGEGFTNFANILNFIKTLSTSKSKIGFEFLIRAMTLTDSQMDSMQFMLLAYEAKNIFGTELKNNFPENFQQLIWGGTQCIRQKLTSQYLVSNRDPLRRYRNLKANATQFGNSSIFNSTLELEFPLGPPNKFGVYTTRSGTNNRVGKEEFCGWEFSAREEGGAIVFIIRQNIKGVWEWNLNVGRNGTLQVCTQNQNPHFTWKVIPQDNGQSFSIYSLHPRNTTVEESDEENALCSRRSRSNKRDVYMGPVDNYCKWYIENPFETELQNVHNK